jgi:hypothetical protein
MMFSNPSSRPIKLSKNELIGTFEPLGPNSQFLYFNETHTFTNKGVQEEKHDPIDDPVDVHLDDPVTYTKDAHHPVMCHETNEEMIDLFGLSDESSNEEESENKEQDEIFEKEDLAWDINPKLKLKWKFRMLEERRNRFFQDTKKDLAKRTDGKFTSGLIFRKSNHHQHTEPVRENKP